MLYICTNGDRDIGTRRRGVSPQHLMAVRRRWAFRSAATFALLCALAGCRFEVSPDSIDVSVDVGQSITESLEIRNTGDEPVDLTLVAEGAAVTLSASAGVLQAGEILDIEISAECASPGERRTDIAVTGRTGNKTITVHVPFVLRCQAETGTHLVSATSHGPPSPTSGSRPMSGDKSSIGSSSRFATAPPTSSSSHSTSSPAWRLWFRVRD